MAGDAPDMRDAVGRDDLELHAPDDRRGEVALEVVTRVNGQERQRGRAADMAFSIPFLISYISDIMTLEPGDLIATGTPAGVGKLSPGDIVEVEVLGVSMVSNPVAPARV